MHETSNGIVEWINRLGTAHWNIAWPMFVQIVVLVVLLGGLELRLRGRVRPVVRYWIWTLVTLKLLLPVTLSSPASVAYWIIPATANELSTPVLPTNIAFSDNSKATQRITPDASLLIPRVGSEPTAPHQQPSDLEQNRDQAPVVSTSTALPRMKSPGLSLSMSGSLLIAWLAGAIFLFTVVVLRALCVRQLVQQAVMPTVELQSLFDSVCDRLGVARQRIGLKISDAVGCPAICGPWRPTVLIPRRLIDQLDENQLRLVFLHEVTHWQQWDLQINLLQTALQIVYFYNPAVWIANAMMRRLREEAVDDAVLVAASGAKSAYGQLLLNVAEQLGQPVEVSLQMIGILESRKALVHRIRRIATQPQPTMAKLGLWGFVAVLVTGLALLPMAGGPSARAIAGDRVVAQNDSPPPSRQESTTDGKPPQTVSPKVSPPDSKESVTKPATERGVLLTGRITDEKGSPVTDARVMISPVDGGRIFEAKVDADGKYSFRKIEKPGKHRLSISSTRCVGFSRGEDRPIVELDNSLTATRDFTLQQACQFRIQMVNKLGEPIPDVWIYHDNRLVIESRSSDKLGWVMIGGLAPSPVEYQFAAMSKAFAVSRLSILAKDPQLVVERKVTLEKGAAIQGSVTCSDGKPAAGWYLRALPAWWDFGSSPRGEVIAADGSFTLPNIGPGPHDVTLSVPSGANTSAAVVLMSDVNLAKLTGPLNLKTEYPSPGSMGLIEGEVQVVGGALKRSFWIHANADKGRFGGGDPIQPGSTKFQIGPVPPGKYRLTINSTELEPIEALTITAPVKDLKIELKVRAGGVSKGDPPQKPMSDIPIKVGPRRTLTGTVVDEQGRPIDGAIVISRRQVGNRLPVSANNVQPGMGARTVQGKFELTDLAVGKEWLHIVHPNYTYEVVNDLDITASGELAPLKIVMRRGNSLQGYVYDQDGQPAAGVKVHFVGGDQIGGNFDGNTGFGIATTDEQGHYKVGNLPNKLVRIRRDDEWNTLGVLTQVALPSPEKTLTVNLGGQTKTTGKLKVNGVPLANQKVLVSDDSPHFGVLKAQAVTDADGMFVFRGLSPGEHFLYYPDPENSQQWCRAISFKGLRSDQDLGTIDFQVSPLEVHKRQDTATEIGTIDVALSYFDPVWLGHPFFGNGSRLQLDQEPVTFSNVPTGRYVVTATRQGKLGSRQTIDFQAGQGEQKVTVDIPQGSAAIRGTLDSEVRKAYISYVEIRSQDERLFVNVEVQSDGSFQFFGLPEGHYFLTTGMVRNPDRLAEFSVRKDETKTLNVTPANFVKMRPSGYVSVQAFTNDGILVPKCDMQLVGAKGIVEPHSHQRGRTSFTAAPGPYQLSVGFPGFEPVRQEVEVKAIEKGSLSLRDRDLRITLSPMGK